MSDKAPKYDLEERTAVFGEQVIALAKLIPVTPANTPIIGQIVRSATSVGANYTEADDAASKKDFRYKIGICCRESKETKHWLRMTAAAEPKLAVDARRLWREAHELVLIFATIGRSSQ